MMIRTIVAVVVLSILVFAGLTPLLGAQLEVDADAPLWMRLGADALLYMHIGGGALGLVSGVIAMLARKGRRLHLIAGRVFFFAMFVSYLIGAGVAPFIEHGQRPNFVAGILALYLLATAWLAARRRNPIVGPVEYIGLAVALFVVAAGSWFMFEGLSDPSGTVDGSPPQAFVLFIVVGTCAAIGDVRVIIRRKISGALRVSRHLWRMCMSFFIAAGSFFFGQEQALPSAMVGTIWQYLPVLFPLIFMIAWLTLQRFNKKYS